ncbi:metallophosphoesterase [Actinokineospora auranticolor]|uniref:Calcineurin-like phosphoesterase family protein n=1 Tax=Actinokineospora auranticolor TaxID=155976 RepID=A0A2S6GDH3_9PSEU|nr:metallophosphoesterase [Actinokineospora auranticolor]PPK63250.1 calcineurin-like phosphoesterase family protein [Actinokineospora auranticolor]
MTRIAVIGDVGGHPDQLRRALDDLGARGDRLPADLTVIQVGDLVDRGPDSLGALDLVERLARDPGWVQLTGNHEAQYLEGGTVFTREPLADAGVRRLREWWATGLLRVAAAVRVGDEDFLVCHAGLTLRCWRELGEPSAAADAAAALNARPALIGREGDHGRDPASGPLWAESGAALHEPWMGYAGVVPFGQIHGHSTVVRFRDRTWHCEGRIRNRAQVDWESRHVRVRVGGRRFIGVDPGHGRTGAESWRPLVLADAILLG